MTDTSRPYVHSAQVYSNGGVPVDLSSSWNSLRACWTIKETDTHIVEVVPFIFTFAIVTTVKARLGEYDDRWCYSTLESAVAAAEAWDPYTQEEPEGWHRHPATGRRRPDGDPSREYINP